MENCIEVKVDGTAASIGEVGEQMAWIGAALRASGGSAGLTTCRPHVHMMRSSVLQPSICTIFYKTETHHHELLPGQRLHSLTSNVALAVGFPVPNDHVSQLGQTTASGNKRDPFSLGAAPFPVAVSLRDRVAARNRLQQGRIVSLVREPNRWPSC